LNKERLREAQERFFMKYPNGFSDPQFLEQVKKHKIEKMRNLAADSFSLEQFENPDMIADSMIKIVVQSSMISIFEKPRFRDCVKGMNQC